ncbi:MAG: hypothetical protein QME79_11300 [Bacillota bacterium]|nr:hypothetical protein [Bacillota bacterium]
MGFIFFLAIAAFLLWLAFRSSKGYWEVPEGAEVLWLAGKLGGQIVLSDQFLEYRGPAGEKFKVLRSQVDTVVLDAKGAGQATLKIIGKGTTLASVTWPRSWAEKAQAWMLQRLETAAAKD